MSKTPVQILNEVLHECMNAGKPEAVIERALLEAKAETLEECHKSFVGFRPTPWAADKFKQEAAAIRKTLNQKEQ